MKKAFVLGVAIICFLSCKKDPDLSNLTPGTVTDIDGNTYPTILINKQEWMAANLKTKTYANGSAIKYHSAIESWKIGEAGSTFYDDDSVSYNTTYGRLYNYSAVTNEKNICPSGWHVPTQEEWEELFEFLGGAENAGAMLKSENTATWIDTTGATNAARFNAEPGGLRDDNGKYFNRRYFAYYWTSTSSDSNKGVGINLSYTSEGAGTFESSNTSGFSVRCVKD